MLGNYAASVVLLNLGDLHVLGSLCNVSTETRDSCPDVGNFNRHPSFD